ncbi:uncharacterized protein LOC132040061 [Lycium ferocissimum]|uniref:uncharacterized protein LOC132040061 n=1 Tax=Lycium ferocissimum TaxID=112874 RepID=UPI0028158122|nr:uncharacterized protein LOC132040061 [Lycium ferocissimum]
MSDFYEKKKDIDFQNHPAYKNRALNDDFDVVNVDDLPQQHPGSMDCGVYVAAFAEFLSSGEGIPVNIDSKFHRQRYGALLCDYAWGKANQNAESDNEQPARPVRPIVDYDAVTIVDDVE